MAAEQLIKTRWTDLVVWPGSDPAAMRTIWQRLGRLACLLLLLGAAGCQGSATSTQTMRVEIAGEVFELELALTPAAQYQGLSDREFIAEDGGMLFVFPYEKERTFVMRDCLVPIDILFLGGRGQVLSAYAMQVEPPGRNDLQLKPYRSEGKSAVVIELKGGTLERLGVGAGDHVDLPIQELKRRAG